MSRRRLLIVGGSDAGTSAALSARSLDPDCDVDVLLEDRFPNFSVCGLPFLLSGEVAGWAEPPTDPRRTSRAGASRCARNTARSPSGTTAGRSSRRRPPGKRRSGMTTS